MEMVITSVRIPVEVKSRIEALAKATGRSKSYLLSEAITQYVENEAWQIAQIDEGLRSADAGRLIPHDEVVAGLIEKGMVTPEGLERARERLSDEW